MTEALSRSAFHPSTSDTEGSDWVTQRSSRAPSLTADSLAVPRNRTWSASENRPLPSAIFKTMLVNPSSNLRNTDFDRRETGCEEQNTLATSIPWPTVSPTLGHPVQALSCTIFILTIFPASARNTARYVSTPSVRPARASCTSSSAARWQVSSARFPAAPLSR